MEADNNTSKQVQVAQAEKTQGAVAQVQAGKGHKKPIDASSFAKSTLHNKIRKGFIGVADLDKTLLTDYTQGKVADFIKQASKQDKIIDLLFVRDKQICFMLDNKNKTIYKVADCTLAQYADYFISKNDYIVQAVADMHPANLRARGLAVDKVAKQAGFTL